MSMGGDLYGLWPLSSNDNDNKIITTRMIMIEVSALQKDTLPSRSVSVVLRTSLHLAVSRHAILRTSLHLAASRHAVRTIVILRSAYIGFEADFVILLTQWPQHDVLVRSGSLIAHHCDAPPLHSWAVVYLRSGHNMFS